MPARSPLNIGLFGDALDPVTGRCLDGMVAYARFHGGISVLDIRTTHDERRPTPIELPAWLADVDGAVLCGPLGATDWPLPTWPGLVDAPKASLRSDSSHDGYPIVDVDPDQVAGLAIEHLLEGRVNSFMHVGVAGCDGSRRRAEGFARVLATRGRAAVTHDLEAAISGDIGDIMMLMRDSRLGNLLTSLPKPVGVLCLNDRVARGIALTCRALGFNVPADVAVVGVDDSPLAQHAVPSITSIRIPYESLAARATALVCGMIREGTGDLPATTIEVVPADRLVARESTIGRDNDPVGRWLGALDQPGSATAAIARITTDLGVSRRTFERQFQRLVGHSPAEELRQRRLDRAKELLEDESVLIGEVAGMVGFTVAAFSRFFRRHTGQTPREYRQNSVHRLLGPSPDATNVGRRRL